MNAAPTIDRITEASPRSKARLTGALYLVTILGGLFAQGFVSARLIDSGDPALTATRILINEPLFRLGFTVYMIEMAAQIAMTVFFYELLRPVNKGVALLSAVFSYVGCGITTFSRLFYLAPTLILGGSHHLAAFSEPQLQAASLLFLRINDQGAGIALAFFGFSTLLKGYLILRSTFWPRWLGVLSMVAGFGWLAFLSPGLGDRLFTYIAVVGLVGSIATIAWLLIVGIDEPRWNEQARVAARSVWA